MTAASIQRRRMLACFFVIAIALLAMPAYAQSTGRISQAAWQVLFVDSQATDCGNYGATNAFDGNPGTMWHTEYCHSPTPPTPHEIQIDLGASYTIAGFQYLPRQDGGTNNGNVANYEFYVSTDGVTWGTAVASGTLIANPSDQTQKQVTFTGVVGRYVRFRAMSEVHGGPWTAVAELNVLGTQVATGGPQVGSLTLNPASIAGGGATSTATVTLTSAPLTNATVTLASSNTAATVPATVIVNAGTTSANFTVTSASSVSTTSLSVINASYNGSTGAAVLTVTPGSTSVSPIPQVGWRLLFVDSQATDCGNYGATNAFDGNPASMWHTEYCHSPTPPTPHEIQIDLGASYTIAGFQYLPRQDGTLGNGNVANYEFYVSTDGANWGAAVATGTLMTSGADKTQKQVTFTGVVGRYVRFRAMSEVHGGPLTAVAELNVLGTPVATSGPQVGSLTLNPASIASGGATSTATVTLTGAPLTNATVTLASSNTSAATVPATVIVNAGTTSANFTVTSASSVSTTSLSVINASYNGSTGAAVLTVIPGGPSLATIPQVGWRLLFVDSQATDCGNYGATNAFDGNVNTIWHTEYCHSSPPTPHEIQIDLGASYTIAGFQYLPRQDGTLGNGNVANYEFYVSTDGANWGAAVATGTLMTSGADKTQKHVTFTGVVGRYVRFRAMSEVHGGPLTAVAELNVLGTPVLTQVNPNSGQQGQQSESVNLTGQFTHWLQGTSSASFGAGISVVSLTVNSATSATAVLTIDPAATVGARNVTVTTNTEVVTLNNGFTVTPSAGPFAISGSITPTPSGVGALMTLSGAASATATADANANYTFTGLAAGTYTVTPSKSGFDFTPGSATVTITNASLTGVDFTASSSSVLISPIRAVVTFGTTQQFTANTAVTWSVDGVTGGNSSVGTISTSGLYTPPPAVGQHTVTAASRADASQTASGTVWVSNSGPILTYKYNNYRNGQNTSETVLTPTNVNTSTFGQLFSYPVDGYNYAEPLYVPNLNIAGGTHNVVFVATEHDSVYAFDADGKQSTPLWHVSFINPSAGILPFSSPEAGYIGPEIGITSTPAIDLSTGTMYVVADTQTNGAGARFQLHALNVHTGAEKFGGPVTISGSVSGTGEPSIGGTLPFDPVQHVQRAALLLANGAIYIAFASYGDNPPYHGWIFTYSASTLANLGIFCATPDGGAGGIWMAGAGMSADSSGNVYVSTGNGTFDILDGGSDYGDSVIKFSSSPSLTVTDWFSPYNNSTLEVLDLDLGSGGLLIFPDGTGGGNLMLIGGKNGALYLLNRDSLGHWQSGSDSQIIQSIQNASPGEIFGTPVWWNGWVYVGALDDFIKAFQLQNGRLTTSPTSATSTYFPDPGAPAPSISANGSSNGILWALEYSEFSEVLHAWDATDLSRELYNSSSDLGDDLGPGVRFTVPTVADGKVFVGTAASLAVYGPTNR